MIDTATESAATLRETAAMLIFIADRMSGPALVPVDVPAAFAAKPLPGVPEGTVESVAAYETARETGTVLPPPPPPAPLPPAAAGVLANAQLDKAGFPWDERIHSETPTLNKSDGLWRMKRGISDKRELVEAVEAELRAVGYGAPAAPVIPPPPAMVIPPPPPVIPPPPPAPAAATASVMVPPPPPVAVGVLPGPAAVDENAEFRKLLTLVGGKTGPEGVLRREVMLPIYAAHGVTGLPDFHKREHRAKIPAVIADINKLLGV
jgi:hypothetical protein